MRSDPSGASSPAFGLPSPAKVLNQPRNCRRSAWRRSCLRPPRRERLIEKSLAEDEGLADNLKSLLATLWHVHARATLNAVEPKGEATMMCGKSRRAGFALLILALILVGCAKRPQLVQAQAPAPTGAAVTEPAAPVVSPQPSVSRAPEPPPTSPTPAVPTPAVPTPPPAKEFAESSRCRTSTSISTGTTSAPTRCRRSRRTSIG